jgi:hypothetical protein
MPTPSNVLATSVGDIVSSFLQIGFEALPVIGVALLGVAGLFVLFYVVARSFGWHLKMPVRPAGRKGVIGNPKKVHFERGKAFSFREAFNGVYSRFWSLQTEVKPTSKFFLRSVGIGGGISEGRPSFGGGDFVPGFGSDFMPFGDGDSSEHEWDSDWLDREDSQDGFYSDPSYDAPWTSDSGPDSSPGRQEGGFNQDINNPEARYLFAQSLLDKLSGGLTFCTVNLDSGASSSRSLQSNFFLGAVYGSDQPSWGFLDSYNGSSTYSDVSSAEDIMRAAEHAWVDMFGWELKLAPDHNFAFSAETTYHALRIMELARMREMGFQGSYSEFMDGLQCFEVGTDSDMYDDVDDDLAAYDR